MKSGGGTGAPGDAQGGAPGITISGTNTMDAVLQGMSTLTREIGAREEALMGASSCIEDLILRGLEKLSHQRKLLYDLWKGLERKGADWKAERDQRKRDIFDQEQQLATREDALLKEVKALDLRR